MLFMSTIEIEKNSSKSMHSNIPFDFLSYSESMSQKAQQQNKIKKELILVEILMKVQ